MFPDISSVDDYFNVTLTDSAKHIEIVTVTARTGDTFTVMRGMENTTARAWLASDILELRITKGLLDQLKLDATKDTAYNLSAHTSNTSNPHSTTANQVGAYTKAETEQLLSDTLLAVPQNIVPETDSIYSLGTSALKWSELHLSGSTIHLGDVTLKDNGDGTFGIYDKTGLSPVTIQSGEKVYATEEC